jgi:hypothetical protein
VAPLGYNAQRSVAELLAIQPDAARVVLNGNECYHYRVAVPAFSIDYLAAPRLNELVVLQARDSYNEQLARILLDFVNGAKFDTDTISVLGGFACPGYSFDRVTVVPPPSVRSFRGRSNFLEACGFWVLPSNLCEFQPKLSADDFSFLISNKGGRIEAMNWNRSPTPQARIRLLTDWPGGMLAKRSKPGVVQWQSVIHMVKELPRNVTVLILNALSDEARITAQPNGYQCTIKPARGTDLDRRVAREGLEDFLKSFLLCKKTG